jgi:DMSO reductase anchor subunit
MHPAFSVLLFTTLSGAGYGLLVWLCVVTLPLRGNALYGDGAVFLLAQLVLAALLVSAGLLSSLGHLGQPQRAWRAFSQWRSSWLSREGVLAVATFVPMALLAWALTRPWREPSSGSALGELGTYSLIAAAVGAMLTVVCTAMIYASLKPIPAWRHPLVVPAYLAFALQTGLLLHAATLPLAGGAAPPQMLVILAALAVIAGVIKLAYWRAIDRKPLSATRASALGLPAERQATVFERPHTEANYLTREMGFVLARKHARKLRAIALVLFGGLPLLACALAWTVPGVATAAMAVAALCGLLGALVERWLFFAEAKHLVTLYY